MKKFQSFVWILLYLPLALQTYRYVAEIVFYGEYLHWTGEQSVLLVLIVLAITPLRLLFANARWVRWLMSFRRDIGVASFVYAFFHLISYLARQANVSDILQDSLEIGLLTGWLAFVIFLLLALTSNDYSVRLLLRRWKLLHRTIYFGIALTFAHWMLTAFNPASAYLYLGIGILLIVLRALQLRNKTSKRTL